MATLTIRDLDELLKIRLRVRAASRNHSMEEEVRQILRAALLEPPPPEKDLAARIRARFVGLHGLELDIAPREPIRTPPSFGVAAKTSSAGKASKRAQGKPSR